MAGNEYLIPIGFDFKGQDTLNQTISTMEQIQQKGGEVQKTLDDAFSKGAKAVDDFDKKTKPVVKNIEALRDAGKLAGKEFQDAFKSPDSSNFEATIEKLKQKFASISAGIKIELPDDKIRIYENELANAKDGVDELKTSLLIMADVAKNLDPNSKEYKALTQGIEETNNALNEFGINVTDVVGKSQTMRSQLLEIRNELNNLESVGQKNSDRFKDLTQQAVQLTTQIKNTDTQIKALASNTKYVDAVIDGVTGLVGAFTAVQGAVGLFAGENEELQKTLLKVNSAMALLQGLQQVQNVLNKDSAFSVVFLSKAQGLYAGTTTAVASALGLEASATGVATVATKAFSIALISIGIGLILIAIAALVEYWDDLTDAVNGFLPAGKSVGKVFDSIKSYAFGIGNAILQYVIAPIKALYQLISTGDVEGAFKTAIKGFNLIDNFQSARLGQNARNEQKYRDEQEQKNIDFAKRELERRKNRGEDVDQLILRNQARQLAFNKRTGKEDADATKAYEDAKDKSIGEALKKRQADAKKAAEEAKKAREKAQKDAEEARKKQIEAEKKANEQIAKFTSEFEDAKIRNIQDSAKKRRAELENEFDDKVKAVKNEKALTKEALETQTNIIIQLEKERNDKRAQLEDDIAKEKLQIQLDANKELANLSEDSAKKEIELLNISAKEQENAIREKYKNEEALKISLLEATEANRVKKEKEISDKYAKKKLSEDEERALLTVELMSQFAKKSEDTELQKQIAIQQIKLDFAKQNLKLLLDSGKGENDIEVLKAKKLVKDTGDALGTAISNNNNKPFDLMQFLGIGNGLTDEQKKSAQKAFGQIATSLGDLTQFVVEQYDRQIQKKQEAIDQFDKEISDLEGQLDKEKQLREDGFANNVDVIEAEIAEKQKQKDEEIRQQQEFLAKKKEMQKVQLALDTALQLSGLITSSVEIFKSLAGIPFIGIPLAIATIGTMFGAFATAKISAFQAINDQTTKFKKGGRLGGKSHEQGGNKFYSADGSGIEHERGEHFFSVEHTRKYGNLFDAITNDNLSRLSPTDSGLVELFKGLGFQTDLLSATKSGNELKLNLMSVGYSPKDGESLKDIKAGILELIRLQNETPVSYSDGVFNILKVGNKTKKTRLIPLNENNESEK